MTRETRFTVDSEGVVEDGKRNLLPAFTSLIEAHSKIKLFGSEEFNSLMESSLKNWRTEDLDFIVLHLEELGGKEQLLPVLQKVLKIKQAEEQERQLKKQIAAKALPPDLAEAKLRGKNKIKDVVRGRGYAILDDPDSTVH